MVHQSYELNEVIPNIEYMFSKMFCSPFTKVSAEGDTDLLAGNIFAQKKVRFSPQVYESLLNTNVIKPKKKHFKKIIQYMRTMEDGSQVSPILIDLVVKIGINH